MPDFPFLLAIAIAAAVVIYLGIDVVRDFRVPFVSQEPLRLEQLEPSALTPDGLIVEGTLIEWDRVVRVARVYEIHPMAIADGFFWALQTADRRISYWVRSEVGSASESLLNERFPHAQVPAMKDWVDNKRCIASFVVWPQREWGRPLYSVVRHRRWSRRSCVALAGGGPDLGSA